MAKGGAPGATVGATQWSRLVFLARGNGVSGWRAVVVDGAAVLFLVADAHLPALLRRLRFDEPPVGADPALHSEMIALLSEVGHPLRVGRRRLSNHGLRYCPAPTTSPE